MRRALALLVVSCMLFVPLSAEAGTGKTNKKLLKKMTKPPCQLKTLLQCLKPCCNKS
jgi:hypothetical protein